MGELAIMAYRARNGRRAQLEDLSRSHIPILRRLNLLTDKPERVLWVDEDMLVEVFEWAEGAENLAPSLPDVKAIRLDYAEVAETIDWSEVPNGRRILTEIC